MAAHGAQLLGNPQWGAAGWMASEEGVHPRLGVTVPGSGASNAGLYWTARLQLVRRGGGLELKLGERRYHSYRVDVAVREWRKRAGCCFLKRCQRNRCRLHCSFTPVRTWRIELPPPFLHQGLLWTLITAGDGPTATS